MLTRVSAHIRYRARELLQQVTSVRITERFTMSTKAKVFVRSSGEGDRMTIEMRFTDPLLRNVALRLQAQADALEKEGNEASASQSEADAKSEANKRKQQVINTRSQAARLISTRQYSFNRLRTEQLGACLRRMQSTIEQNRAKMLRKAVKANDRETCNEQLRVQLFKRDSDVPVEDALPNDAAWNSSSLLRISDSEMEVVRNPPTVSNLQLPNETMVSLTVFALADVQFADPSRTRVEWFLLDGNRAKQKNAEEEESDAESDLEPSHVGHSFQLRPQHVGKFLRVRAVAVSEEGLEGPPVVVTASKPISFKPTYKSEDSANCAEDRSLFLFQKRALRYGLDRPMAASRDEPFRFRVVSYNLLADLYADSDFSRGYLFAHCPDHILALNYREPLMHAELSGYHGDVLCTQELDRKVYERLSSGVLSSRTGYSSVFRQKYHELPEGSGIFFRSDRFELVQERALNVTTALFRPGSVKLTHRKRNTNAANGSDDSDNAAKKSIEIRLEPSKTLFVSYETSMDTAAEDEREVGSLRTLLSRVGLFDQARATAFETVEDALLSNANLLTRWLQRKTMLHCAVLRPVARPEQLLVVANTHLYFHPNASHIRALQSWVCAQFLEALKSELTQQNKQVAVVFCGDFNSQPDTLSYSVLANGFVSPTAAAWFAAGRQEHFPAGAALTHGLRLANATGTPPYTTLVPGFHGCLDYCFYDTSSLSLLRTVPLPDHEQICELVALPNQEMPSDHMAVICELQLL